MWVKNTGAWHIMHSYRVGSAGYPFILSVDGFTFPAVTAKLTNSRPDFKNICRNCNGIDYFIRNTTEVDDDSILSSNIQ